MRCLRTRAAASWLIAVAVTAPVGSPSADPPGPAEAPAPGLSERIDVHLRTLRFRVEPRRGAPADACTDLGLAHVRVRLRGRVVAERDVLEVSSEARGPRSGRRRPATHAIVLDASFSMLERLDFARRAAAEYVRSLPEGDRALVFAFDDDVVLMQPATADREALGAAIDRIPIGGHTSLHDAAIAAIGELALHPGPGVLVLVTDGADSVSLHGAHRAYELLESRPGIAVFAIGVSLPDMRGGASSVTPKKFLGKIAGSTGGEFLDVPTVARLDAAWKRVRAMLDDVWTVTVVDHDPDARPDPAVRVRGRRCGVTLLPSTDGPPAPRPASTGGDRLAIVPDPDHLRAAGRRARDLDACRARYETLEEDAPWFVRWREAGVDGCGLDVWIEDGILYDAFEVGWRWHNPALWLTTRPFRIDLPAPEALPERPEQMFEAVAGRAAALPAEPPRRGGRQKPGRLHARPWEDADFLWHADTWLDAREELAQAFAAVPPYAAWLERQTADEAEAELGRWRDELGRLAPELPAGDLDRLARDSQRGRRILERAARPGARTVEARLGAWLGDVSAHELFVRWEAARIAEAAAAGVPVDPDLDRLWAAARALVWVPSYGRVLVPLVPGIDREHGRIGFWRIVLPRSGWMLPRVQGPRHHEEFERVPFDLVPPRPLAAWLWNEVLGRDRALAAKAAGRSVEVDYEPLARPRRVKPGRAFERTRVTLRFAGGGDAFEIAGEIALDEDDPVLAPDLVALDVDGARLAPAARAGLASGGN